MVKHTPRQWIVSSLIVAAWVVISGAASAQWQQGASPPSGPPAMVRKITAANERQEMIVNSSRIFTLDKKIPQAQVNNPDILELTALSPNQIQVFAKKAGVTQVNLWDEDNQIYTVDVIVYGDARELTMLLETQFPNASIQVIPVSNGVLISGYVDQPEHVSRIVQIAEEYYPKVISNMTVGGVHQVLLHVKVMEVSRTKLRSLGFDWSQISGNNVFRSSASGLIADATPAQTTYDPSTGILMSSPASVVTSGGETLFFSVLSGTNAFFGVLEAMRQDNLAKVMAEPTLVTVSGRPAFFQVGGEFPILVPQSLGTVAIEYKKYGTQVDFVPIVLGNGRVRLEVRPRVSEIDSTRSVTINSTTVPGLKTREVDTGVEMQAGQTLAIAGLVQNRIESERRGLPWISEVPYLGMMFGRVREQNNEVELLILVTPELVDAMDAQEVPPCGPGSRTTTPSDFQLYFRRHIEVPTCCPPGSPGTDAEPQPDMMTSPETVQPPAPSAPVEPAGPAAGPAAGSTSRVVRPSRAASPSPPASVARRNPPTRQTRPATSPSSGAQGQLPGFMGPVGYDVPR